jgi:hypothetical protein
VKNLRDNLDIMSQLNTLDVSEEKYREEKRRG